jgi:ATP-dependent 26S proteasome regulatory subunit
MLSLCVRARCPPFLWCVSALCAQCSSNFLSVKGPELINMYVGESERQVCSSGWAHVVVARQPCCL